MPTQTLLGATREGCKVDILRQIKLIEFDGAYGPTLDSDGVPLVRYERLVGKITLKSLYLKYFNRKIISDCESDGTWESGNWGNDGGTYAAETTIVNSGDQSAKCSIASAQTGHGIHEVFASAKDLTAFDNSETSDTADYIGFSIYITTAMLAILGTDSIQLRIHKDAEETETNYYWYDVEASALTADQWTNLKVLKSAFTEEGTASWSAVTGISFEVPDATDDALEFYVDSIDLIQAQTDSSVLPVNGSTFTYTDETTYKQYSPDLEIGNDDYLENITIIGQRMDGKKMKIVLKNAFNDGKLELAFEDKDESVNETEFTGHYKYGSGLICPIEIYEYVA
ncbi:MAG: hypothetical protein PVJ67_05030 [Candidatus Pacearchaeota archaeon]